MILTNKISNITMIFITIAASILILYLENIAIFFIVIYLWIVVLRENRIVNLKSKMYHLIEKNKNF